MTLIPPLPAQHPDSTTGCTYNYRPRTLLTATCGPSCHESAQPCTMLDMPIMPHHPHHHHHHGNTPGNNEPGGSEDASPPSSSWQHNNPGNNEPGGSGEVEYARWDPGGGGGIPPAGPASPSQPPTIWGAPWAAATAAGSPLVRCRCWKTHCMKWRLTYGQGVRERERECVCVCV